jgi:hypothetical protein
MLYVLGPGVLIAVGGGILGSVTSLFVSPGNAAGLGRWAVVAVALSAGAAVTASIALPDEPVLNGPIGATCPDTGSALFDVLVAFAVASVVAGVTAVASATVEGAKGAATGGTFGRLAFAILAPYVALAALVFPLLCDYS